jgi:transcriptional regulator with XRE-family HTH domain
MAKDFGSRLKTLAKERGMSLRKLSEAAGIHWNQMSRYSAGGSLPSAENLSKIARALGVGMDWLWEGDGPGFPKEPPPPEDLSGDLSMEEVCQELRTLRRRVDMLERALIG